jgi:hypothetical protein
MSIFKKKLCYLLKNLGWHRFFWEWYEFWRFF